MILGKRRCLLAVGVLISLAGCGLRHQPLPDPRAELCAAELVEFELLACNTFGLNPPVTLERLFWCNCGHLTFRFVDSSQKELKVHYCNRIASYSFGSPDSRLFTLGDCHRRSAGQPAFSATSTEGMAVQALLGLWLAGSFTPMELHTISLQPEECMNDYPDPSAYAQVILRIVDHNPESFATVVNILACGT